MQKPKKRWPNCAGFCKKSLKRSFVKRGQHDVNQSGTCRSAVREGGFQQARSQGHGGVLLRRSSPRTGKWQGCQSCGIRKLPVARKAATARPQPENRRGNPDFRRPRRDVPRIAKTQIDGGTAFPWKPAEALNTSFRRSRPNVI